MNRRTLSIALATVVLATVATGCNQCPLPAPDPAESGGPVPISAADPHSFSNAHEVPLEHLELDLRVDFETRRLEGRATWTLGEHQASRLVLDTSKLDVVEVALDGGKPTSWYLAPPVDLLGRALVIDLEPATRSVTMTYTTSNQAAALQWLAPAQTATGERPFLFSQSQAILARSWVPSPDSPGVRFRWDATVHAPADLEVLMSAERTAAPPAVEGESERTFRFRMEHPVPSYLLAIAVGQLERRELGARTAVWAEGPVADAAAYEFAETETMIVEVEKLYGPYRWGRYDLLVLPPSFPYGGMENPLLTFLTPTIIAGDRSLVALIAHELAHSWSGNLVTNANWNDFWLNEGFTTYLERRIMEALHGRDYAEMLASLGREDLESTVEDLGATSPDTRLRLELEGRDPDDGMNDIAYEKGAFFLRRIEEAVGRERFDAFLASWFEARAFVPTTTDDFLAFVDEKLPEAREKVDLLAWIDGPGLPADIPVVSSSRLAAAEAAARQVADGTPPKLLDTKNWSAHEWRRFLKALPKPLALETLAALDASFGFTTSGNSEVLALWFEHSIASGYAPADAALEQFLMQVGRRKFLQPIYQALVAVPNGRERALAIYTKARPGYHSVSVGTLDEILKWEAATATPTS